MKAIGIFERNNDQLIRRIATVGLATKASFVPVKERVPAGPAYRLYAGEFELGAAWERRAKVSGLEYWSVKLDDPSFAAPIYASLFAREDGEYVLTWARQ